MDKQIIVSVVIPVYNVENFLRKCLDSIIVQTYQHWECILVDDGSTDNSGRICDEYAEKDTRFSAYHKKNGGASSARNTGLEKTHGKYLCFIDADDYVSSQYLSNLVEDSEYEKDTDLVIQGSHKVFPNGMIQDCIPKPRTINLSYDTQLFYSIYRYFAPFSKLFRFDIIEENNLRFNTNLIIAEDYDFLLKYLSHIRIIRVSDKANYYYNSNDGSLSSRLYSFEQEYNAFRNTYDLAKVYNNRYYYGKWFSAPSFLLNRTLISNYLNVYKKEQRLEHLSKFTDDERRMFRLNFKADTLFLKLVRFLFTYRMDTILDILLHWRITPNKK